MRLCSYLPLFTVNLLMYLTLDPIEEHVSEKDATK